jgi:FeS assembly SUF system protein
MAETTPSEEPSAAPGDAEAIRGRVIDELRTIFDPEIPVNIYELGLVYDVEVSGEGAVDVRMTLTSPMCPAVEELPSEAEFKIRQVPGVTGVTLDLVWDPPWSPDMMSEAAKLELGML